MDFGGRQVLVTGADGWLGRNLVQALAQGLADHPSLKQPDGKLRLRCLVLPGQDAAVRALFPKAQIVEGDLRDPEACAALCQDSGGGTLFHLAGMIHPRRVAEFYQVNVTGAENVLDAAAAAGVQRAVVVSSNSPFGVNPHPDHLFDEDSPYRPYMHYGRSKVRLEEAVKARQEAGQLETVLVRAPWFYGPHQPPRQSLFFSMIRKGQGPVVGSGENLRSMAYTDNLAQGLLLAALTPAAAGRAYWVADERPYTMNQVLDTVERLLEQEFGMQVAHKRMRLPGLAAEVAYVCDWALQSLGLYHQKIHVLSEMNKTIACSVRLAQQELDYRPAVALEEGMRRSIRWCLDQGQEI